MPIPPKIAAIYLLGVLWKEDCDRFTRVTAEGLLSADEMDAVETGQRQEVQQRQDTGEQSGHHQPHEITVLLFLPLLLPVMGLIALAIKLDSPGENGKPFWMLKIQNYSLLLDLRILWRTLGAVFKRNGAC